ncbi:ABC transporter ATP-binding protein [soil metagenome]
MKDVVLRAENLKKTFGALAATNDVSFELREGEILGLIGPNGAGKTTLVNLLTGVDKPSEGRVEFGGKDITGWAPHRVGSTGLSRTFQVVKPFLHMSVQENVTVGALFGQGQRKSMNTARERADEVLELVELAPKADAPAASLTLQDRKRLELAKALAADPTALLLDEVMAGLHATEIENAISLVRRIGEGGVSVVVIEHVMKAIMQLCDRIIVLDQGAIIAEGEPEQVVRDPAVIRAYLGERWAERMEQDGEENRSEA